MKKTDLEKHKALKIVSRMKQSTAPGRPGQAAPIDRREQRRLDQERGLVPFAIKLETTLVAELRTLAESSGVPLNDCVSELLRKGLGAKRKT